jgi:hypothetical protein
VGGHRLLWGLLSLILTVVLILIILPPPISLLLPHFPHLLSPSPLPLPILHAILLALQAIAPELLQFSFSVVVSYAHNNPVASFFCLLEGRKNEGESVNEDFESLGKKRK